MISYIIFKDNKVLLNKSNNKYIFPKYEMDNEANLINIINKEFNTSVKVLDNITKDNINVYILSTNNIDLNNNYELIEISELINYKFDNKDIFLVELSLTYKYLSKCMLCPRKCNVNRYKTLGFCNSNNCLKIANYSLHMWEEPCISGKNGSGTIFFSYCNLKCIYCQNYEISTLHKGKNISIYELSDIMINLQNKGANNINLVTPTHYIILIKYAIILAKKKGLTIPIVYNTSGYEDINSINLLKGLVQVYLPDLKYYDNNLSIKYSKCNDYFKITTLAIKEMYKQVGKIKFDNNGIIKSGLIVRHLVLPGHIEDSKKIIKYLYDTYKDNIYISIMNQYTPLRKLEVDNLNRKLTDKEYDEVIDYAYDIGVRNAFIQEGETQSDSFIPIFSDEI